MALKLTRRSGESIILNFIDANGDEQVIRILLRKLKRSGDMELEYYSSIDATVQSPSGGESLINKGSHVTLLHNLRDDIRVNVTDDGTCTCILNFGIEYHLGLQAKMWFDAPRNVIILRDELENVA